MIYMIIMIILQFLFVKPPRQKIKKEPKQEVVTRFASLGLLWFESAEGAGGAAPRPNQRDGLYPSVKKEDLMTPAKKQQMQKDLIK
ncbi:hypothetical protein [Eubacterium barkeri]|uniref:hypothetical protein n=1 Tax=Eubacterium barkeri TaxID=1528 RepID=UPI000B7CD19D|nr:hypothetical protein [Eubacterium barkeri]